jgi:hypothetical protein
MTIGEISDRRSKNTKDSGENVKSLWENREE